MPPPWEPI